MFKKFLSMLLSGTLALSPIAGYVAYNTVTAYAAEGDGTENQEVHADNPEGTTVDSNHDQYNDNHGSIVRNEDSSDTNPFRGVVDENHGEIGSYNNEEHAPVPATGNYGDVGTNYGAVWTNQETGVVDVNAAGTDAVPSPDGGITPEIPAQDPGSIAVNEGTVNLNAGIVAENSGIVTSNEGIVVSNTAANTETGTSEGQVVTNNGEVKTNEGTITNNASAVTDDESTTDVDESKNAGTVGTNKGTVTTNSKGATVSNNGTDSGSNASTKVENNNGTVTTNHSGATVTNNGSGADGADNTGASITTNKGNVETNHAGASIGSNEGDAQITTNKGTIASNSAKADAVNAENAGVKTNSGNITSNSGSVGENMESATIDLNTGTIFVNNGTVGEAGESTNKNGGTVFENNGTVYQNEDGVVAINFGGDVNGGTININLNKEGATGEVSETNVLKNFFGFISSAFDKLNIFGSEEVTGEGEDAIYEERNAEGSEVEFYLQENRLDASTGFMSDYRATLKPKDDNQKITNIGLSDDDLAKIDDVIYNEDGSVTLVGIHGVINVSPNFESKVKPTPKPDPKPSPQPEPKKESKAPDYNVDYYSQMQEFMRLAMGNSGVLGVREESNTSSSPSDSSSEQSSATVVAPTIAKAPEGSPLVAAGDILAVSTAEDGTPSVVTVVPLANASLAATQVNFACGSLSSQMDVSKATLLTSVSMKLNSTGAVSMSLTKIALSPNDVVYAVFTDLATNQISFTKATVNANGTITFNVPCSSCVVSIIRF